MLWKETSRNHRSEHWLSHSSELFLLDDVKPGSPVVPVLMSFLSPFSSLISFSDKKTFKQLESKLTVNYSESEAYRQNHLNLILLGMVLCFKLCNKCEIT